ncbi:MAG TPA: tetratricopeptide repeat protein [Polyangiaceae bacterium]|nr:tetratricopeptide repeat protein [Polyangiaceae bacterium]
MKTRLRSALPVAACAVWLSSAWTAHADVTSENEAKALFREGRALAATGNYEAACPKFEQSLKLDPGIGTKFNLADCYEHVGRTASARTLFLEVASIAREAGQGDREQVAAARAKDLEPQIHRLTIDISGKQSGLTVKRDGVEVPPSQWGTPQFVDPGAYDVSVTAPGKKAWKSHVEVPRSGDATLKVPELEDEGAPAADAAPAPAAATEQPKTEPEKEAPPAEPPAEDKPDHPDLAVPLILYGGLGASAILAGTALILYKSANDKAASICPTGLDCSREQIQQHQGYVNDARDARTLAYVALGVGVAAGITGATLAIVRSGKENHPNAARIDAAPVISPGLLGAAMEGRF